MSAIWSSSVRARAVPAVYAPSARFRAAWIEHLRGPVAAAALIAPQAAVLLDRLGDPAISASFLRLQGGCLFESTVAAGFEGPVVDCFYNPLAGVQILSALIAGGEDGRFPSRTPAPLAAGQLARELGVSRMHVRRVLLAAIGAGLLTPYPGGTYALSEPADERCASSTRPARLPADPRRPDLAAAWPGRPQ